MQQVSALHGLSEEEAAKRYAEGLSNQGIDVKTKSVPRIISEHLFTLFNAVNVVLALLVLLVGEPKNMLFMGVVLANLLIGVVQEIRAKRMVDRLTILTRQDVRVIRDNREYLLAPDALVIDDVIRISSGEQVPADAQVLDGEARLDESLLTGESLPVSKQHGNELLSGSVVVSGSVVARVCRVGAEGFAAGLAAEAKQLRPDPSQIMATLRLIVAVGATALIPLGLALFARTYVMEASSFQHAVLSSVAAVIGMIPQGLILLTSSVLAIATVRLGSRSVLIQRASCVETLARVDTLCLDKTGTITSGRMEVASFIAASDYKQEEVTSAIAAVVRANEHDANDTAQALLAYMDVNNVESESIKQAIPFDSSRKCSGCVTSGGTAWVLGAAAFVLGQTRLDEVNNLALDVNPTERVLVLVRADGFDKEGRPHGELSLAGLVTLRDEVRATAHQTISYFREQGVEVRVISGDDPKTVSAIAERAGVEGADRAVDASTLTTYADLERAASRYQIFGRVTPHQKRDLVGIFQKAGHTVAMTGDGVNDVLALREADCSVAMSSGSAAARNVADVVLADNDFAHMPEVVGEGRRSINNLQRSASLFLVKTVFAAVLACLCILAPPYPFVPIQMSLLSLAVIGIPSFVLALEPNHELVRGSFLSNVLARSLPASLAIVLAVGAELLCARVFGHSFAQTSTVCTALVSMVGVALVIRLSVPFTPLRVALLIVVVSVLMLGYTFAAQLFEFAAPTNTMWGVMIIAGIAAVSIFEVAYRLSTQKNSGDGPFAVAIQRLEERYVRSS